MFWFPSRRKLVTVLSRITPEALADLRLEEGATAWAVVKAHALSGDCR